MAASFSQKDRDICSSLSDGIGKLLQDRKMRFMEVCGTHTCAIFQSGLRSLLPENVIHISGPGCPVCVTHEAEVALFLQIARQKNTIIATFGDLLRVPGPDGTSLKNTKAEGAKISIVYSPLDALKLAEENPESEVVFLGVGFETTAPAVAASIITAQNRKIKNLSVLSMHKLVPPAIRAILENGNSQIDAFLLPGHVATITGLHPFEFVAKEYHRPGVVGGFEPVEILFALRMLAEQLHKPEIKNAYTKAVANEGNTRARSLLNQVFHTSDTSWRGLGKIPQSGLSIREEFKSFDAMKRFDLKMPSVSPGMCRCGQVLQGLISPPQCPLFGKKCVPSAPVGPCMVSTEGSCAAFYKYGGY